ncbi:MAG: glycoside hydrolase family 130 protein [Phycisphaerae bacterium]
MHDATQILKRHPANPILTREHLPGSMAVFNPSPVLVGDETILLLSAYEFEKKRRAYGTWVARSRDGVRFTIDPEPLIDLADAGPPFDILNCTFIDTRLTPIEGSYYLQTPAFTADGQGPMVLLGKTDDFRSYKPIELTGLPPNRGSSLFPEKIGGKYHRLDRPGAVNMAGAIWLSSSPDLIHWGCHRPLMKPGFATWANMKIGPTPPIKTAAGWLMLLHGVMSWTGADRHYYIGAALLDLNDPAKLIGFTRSWLLAPEAPYELAGQVSNVVFPCGAIARPERDELWVYYGAADTCVGLATGSLSAVVEACLRQI